MWLNRVTFFISFLISIYFYRKIVEFFKMKQDINIVGNKSYQNYINCKSVHNTAKYNPKLTYYYIQIKQSKLGFFFSFSSFPLT